MKRSTSHLLRSVLLLSCAIPAAADDNYFYAGGKKSPLTPATDWIGMEMTAADQTAEVNKQVSDAGLLRPGQSVVTHTQMQIVVLPVVSGQTGKAQSSVTKGVKRTVRVFQNGLTDPIVEALLVPAREFCRANMAS